MFEGLLRKIAAIVLLMLLLLTDMTCVFASKIEDATQSVMLVISTNGTEAATGTGFIIGNQKNSNRYLVTNYHVISLNPENIFVWAAPGRVVPVEAVLVSVDKDIAVLELPPELCNRPAILLQKCSDVSVAQKVFALGFPGAALELSDEKTARPEDVTVSSGIVSKKVKFNGVNYLQIDVDINHGNSGGPLITEDGAVVGINTMGFAVGINGAIQIDELIGLIETKGIPYELYSQKKVDSSASNDSSSKDRVAVDNSAGNQDKSDDASLKKTDNNSSAGNQDKPDDASLKKTDSNSSTDNQGKPDDVSLKKTDSNSGIQGFITNNKVIIAVAFVFILAFIVLAVGLTTRRKPASQLQNQRVDPVAREITPTPEINRKRPILIGIAGVFSGKSFGMESGMLVLGRDPGVCNIVYPSATPGISGRHCEISYDSLSGKFILKDCGSSYGTFTGKGEKLIAGKLYRLDYGESFYLANSSNKFEVRLES